MPANYPLHPACELFPPMSAEEFNDLKEDIKKNGVLQDILTWKGQLVDGRHRIKACEELGIQWDHVVVQMEESDDPVAWAIGSNLHRRHLSQSQKSMVADKVRGIYDAEAKERHRAGSQAGGETAGNGRSRVQENLPEPKTLPAKQARDKAAETVGVSGKLADAARTVRREGSRELIDAVERGDVAVSAAAEVAKAKPKLEQTKAVKNGTVKQEASRIRAEKKKPKSNKAAATALAKSVESDVKAFLKLKPSPEDLSPIITSLDQALTDVESAMQSTPGET